MRIILELHHHFITTFLSFPFNSFCKELDEWIEIKYCPDKIDEKVYKIIITADVDELVQQNCFHLFFRKLCHGNYGQQDYRL